MTRAANLGFRLSGRRAPFDLQGAAHGPDLVRVRTAIGGCAAVELDRRRCVRYFADVAGPQPAAWHDDQAPRGAFNEVADEALPLRRGRGLARCEEAFDAELDEPIKDGQGVTGFVECEVEGDGERAGSRRQCPPSA